MDSAKGRGVWGDRGGNILLNTPFNQGMYLQGGLFHHFGGIYTPYTPQEKGSFYVRIGSLTYQENCLSDSVCPIYGYLLGKHGNMPS